MIKLGDAKIVLVEDFPCERKEQLIARERFYIENNTCVNKCVPGRTKKEYRATHKEEAKEYREKNKGKLKEQRKNWGVKNKEKIKDYNERNKERTNEWRENNKEKIKEYNERNKERRNRKVTCECGREINIRSKSRHEKSKFHQESVSQSE